MTTRTRIAITLLASSLALGVAAPASADEPPPPPDAAKLTRLVGKWKGKGSYRWGKKTGTLQASWSCRPVAGDVGVLCDFEVSGIEGLPSVIRETDHGVRAAIYYPDRLIARLEAHPPHRGLGEANVDAFAALVEEVDHLLCIAEAAVRRRPVSLLELELHADVSKALVLARFLVGDPPRPLDAARRTWLRYHLFHKGEWAGADEGERARYGEAARLALRFLDGLERLGPGERLQTLRAFHATGGAGKRELIERLAAA